MSEVKTQEKISMLSALKSMLMEEAGKFKVLAKDEIKKSAIVDVNKSAVKGKKVKEYNYEKAALYISDVISQRMTDLTEEVIFSNPDNPVHYLNHYFESEYNRKIFSKLNLKYEILSGKPLFNFKLIPDSSFVEKGVINSLTPFKETCVSITDIPFMMVIGKPGTGKSVFLKRILMEVLKNVMLRVAKGDESTIDDMLGLFIADSKNELQQEAADLFYGIKVLDKNTGKYEPYLKLITPEKKILNVRGKNITIEPTLVDLIGNLPINVVLEQVWKLLVDNDEGGSDPYWADSAYLLMIFVGMMNHFCVKASKKKRTFQRVILDNIDDPLALMKNVEKWNTQLSKLSLLEQELFYYDLFQCEYHRQDMWLKSFNSKLSHMDSDISRMNHKVMVEMEAIKLMNIAKERLASTGKFDINNSDYVDEINSLVKEEEFSNSVACRVEDIVAHIGSIDQKTIREQFTVEELHHISQIAEYNKRYFAKIISYARTTLVETAEQTMGTIKGVLAQKLKPITSNPVIAPWLNAENGITGADCCKGYALALYISRDEYPQMYDFVQKTLQIQYYNMLRKRTGTWKNKESNINLGIDPYQVRVLEVTDEEYLTMNVDAVNSILAIIRSLGGMRISATQYKTQYDEKLGGGDSITTAVASNYFDIMAQNLVMFESNTPTHEYVSAMLGQCTRNYTMTNDDVPSHIDKVRIKNAIDMGYSGNVYHKALEENKRYSHEKDGSPSNYDVTHIRPQALEYTLPPFGAVTVDLGNIYQHGEGKRKGDYDMSNLLKGTFKCFAVLRQGGIPQYGMCTMVPHFLDDEFDNCKDKDVYIKETLETRAKEEAEKYQALKRQRSLSK